MVDTFTPYLNLTKPEVGASRDTWGTKENTNLDILDAEAKRVNDGLGASTSQCEAIWVDTQTCRLIAKTGPYVIIDGKPMKIPAVGVEFKFATGSGVIAGNNYLVAYRDVSDAQNPKIALKAVQTARATHSTLGYATCGTDSETLIAGFYAQTDKTVLNDPKNRHFATWYNKRNRMLVGDAGNGSTGSQSYVEANAAVRISAYMWGDRPILGFCAGSLYNDTYGPVYTAISLDGSTSLDKIRETYGEAVGSNPAGIVSATPSGPLNPGADGMHFVGAYMRTYYTGVQTWRDIRISAMVEM